MNYRHAYHAGNFADVIKHVILVALLEQLAGKEKGLCYLDTHAGTGLYDLQGVAAQKTAEFREGVERMLAAADLPGPAARYVELVGGADGGGQLREYPGSAELARRLLRPQDRAVLFELHPDDAAALKQQYRSCARVAVHAADGYRAVRAFVPPPEGRGLMLVDPPFERADEFARLLELLTAVHRAWRSGVLAFWYPLKDAGALQAFHRGLIGSGVRKILRVELSVRAAPGALRGTGMVIVNPPWGLPERLLEALPRVGDVLAEGYLEDPPELRVEYLVPE
jgi:23S rRNA (adenine2030-N6)-methyltransferase